MFGVQQDKNILGAYCFFWIVSMLLTLLIVCTKEATSLSHFKLFTAVPYGLYGAIGLDTFNALRVNDALDYPGLSLFATGQAFHGLFGIALFLWSFFSFLFSNRIQSMGPDKKLLWSSQFRSRTFFYIVFVELTLVAMIITATALSYAHVPIGYAGCRSSRLQGTDLEIISDIVYVNEKKLCVRVVTTQILAIMTAILAIFQTVNYIPLIAYPRVVRYFLYLIFDNVPPKHKFAPVKEKDAEEYDMVQLVPQVKCLGENQGLHKLLTDDTIAEKVARHLHFVDITNLSRASRSVRQSIQGHKRKLREKRLQLFCEASCVEGQKSECWACARIICKACQQLRCNIPEPRTKTHATSCFAVCTTCYLLRAPALPPPKAALERSDDLSVQHNDCWKRCAKRELLTKNVALCKACNLLSNNGVSDVRERRDADALRKARGGRLWCAECQKSLGRGKRRWFICETGSHECHWQGHQLC